MFFKNRQVMTPDGAGVVTRVEDYDDYGAEYFVQTASGERGYRYRELNTVDDAFTRSIDAVADAIEAEIGRSDGPVRALKERWSPSAAVVEAVKAALAVAPQTAGLGTLSTVLECVSQETGVRSGDGVWFPLVAAIYPERLETANGVQRWGKAMDEVDEAERLLKVRQ
jgi:hypothetical protein